MLDLAGVRETEVVSLRGPAQRTEKKMTLWLAAALLACKAPDAENPAPWTFETTRGETWRPQVHFSPAENWLNDPNGLVWLEGEWHLFYQHQPDFDVWGPMHWGHAVSTDLFHWEDLPIAFSPDPVLGMAFSGSAIADEDNATGLCAGSSCLIAMLTHHGGDDGTEKQSLAVSDDRGRTWALHEDNPVLPNPGIADFRDPKIIRWEGEYVMVLAVGDHVAFYRSDDLLQWTWTGDFGPEGVDGGVWECPELFALTDDDGVEHWVLQVDTNPGGPQGGSGAHWFVGDFDGENFSGVSAGYADYGADFYAAQSWSNAPDGRRIWTAWMGNWLYALFTPTSPWRGVMTVPREVSLVGGGEAVQLSQRPVAELLDLRTDVLARERDLEVVDRYDLPDADLFDLELEATVGDRDLEIVVRAGGSEETRIGYVGGELFVDRSRSGEDSFSEFFAGRHSLPIALEELDLRVVVDWSSIEVFAQDGTVVFTDQIFPDPDSRGLRIETNGRVDIHRLEVHALRSGWETGGD